MAGLPCSHETCSSNWRQIVTSLYPDALTRTYCVPPVHFNKVPYVRDTVPGTGHTALLLHRPSGACPPVHKVPAVSQGSVLSIPRSLWTQESQPQTVPARVLVSDFHDDFAQNHVMLNLQELASSRHEVMFILSQLSFGDYLNQPAYAAAAAQLPRLTGLDTKQIKYSDGEVDFLLIHRQHGILIGELKSVGRSQAVANNQQPPADSDVTKRVERAVKQLDRSETVVRHLVSDVAPGLTVRKTLLLPYVNRSHLRRVLSNNPQLEQAMCQSLGAANAAEAVQLCCCSDQLSDPASYWYLTPAALSQLSAWWQRRMACTVDTTVSTLNDQLYLDIAARFVGPATTVSVHSHNKVRVEVRTAGQAVAELGRRLAQLVLTLQQLDLMHKDLPRVCVTGPPGTGKTVVLVLQGLRWLQQGHDVHVVSTDQDSRCISRAITEQLRMSLSADPTPPSPMPGTVSCHLYDFSNREEDVEKAVTDLLACVENDGLYVLIDEAYFSDRYRTGPRHARLVSQLNHKVPHLHLWVSCIRHTHVPEALHLEALTIPMRSAPAVLREIQPVLGQYEGEVHDYTDIGLPAPGDGLRVIHLFHHGDGHTGRWPLDCAQCGQEISKELRRLGVGTGSNIDNTPAPLSYRDVFVLTRSGDLQDDVTDDAGEVTSAASGVVLGLRAEGVPVCVMGDKDVRRDEERWERDIHDVALATTDQILVADYDYVSGMERRVVVTLQARDQSDDKKGLTDEQVDCADRLYAASRCTTQLVMVRVPSENCRITGTAATAATIQPTIFTASTTTATTLHPAIFTSTATTDTTDTTTTTLQPTICSPTVTTTSPTISTSNATTATTLITTTITTTLHPTICSSTATIATTIATDTTTTLDPPVASRTTTTITALYCTVAAITTSSTSD